MVRVVTLNYQLSRSIKLSAVVEAIARKTYMFSVSIIEFMKIPSLKSSSTSRQC